MTVTPAGWYPDPEQPGGLRYWDGTVWTEHRQAPMPQPPPAGQAPPPGAPTATFPGATPAPTAMYPGPFAPAPAYIPPSGMSAGVKVLLIILAVFVVGLGGCVALAAVAIHHTANRINNAFARTVDNGTYNGPNPPHKDVTLRTCQANSDGTIGAGGDITNHSSGTSNYVVYVQFVDTASRVLGSATAFENSVASGASLQWSASGVAPGGAGAVSCRIATVTRLATP